MSKNLNKLLFAITAFFIVFIASTVFSYAKLPEKIVGITIPVNFKDETSPITKQQLSDLMNKEGYGDFNNRGSVRDYFWGISDGKLEYTNIVTDFVTTKYDKSHYNDLERNCGDVGAELANEVLKTLKENFDFSGITKDQNNTVYALNILFAGYRSSKFTKGLWPHKGNLSPLFKVSENIYFENYQISDITNKPQIQTIIHENGHLLLGLEDTYDGEESLGAGAFDLMSVSGIYKTTAPPPNPFFLNRLGWCELINLENYPQNTPITAKPNARDAFVYYNPNNHNEFFIFQNIKRDVTVRKAVAASTGFLIWHIDKSVGHNGFQQMTPSLHYMVSVEQADGCYHMEKKIGSDILDDLYNIGYKTEFSPFTTPNTKWWDGTDSNLSIKLIEKNGDDIMFSYSTGSKNISQGKVAKQSSTYFGCDAFRAVDGNVDGNWNNNSVTHTNSDSNAWWQVDLGNTYCIDNIKIYNRNDACMDRLSNYKVSIMNSKGTEVWSANQTNYPNPGTTLSVPNIAGKYVKIQLSGTNSLSLAEVEVFGKENIAIGRETSQSSDYFGCLAGKAVDGNTDGNWNNSSITHTNLDTNAWWKVNLVSNYVINGIQIYNRTDACMDRLSNYKVSILNKDGDEVWSTNQMNYPNPSTYINVPNIAGQYVRIQLNGTNNLSLAEVMVFGERNIAFSKNAAQSSDYFGCTADRATDGNIDGNWNNGSITHTNNDQYAWWQVDLSSNFYIEGIRIYNRTDACMDRLNNYRVSIVDTSGKEIWSEILTHYPKNSTYISVPNIGGRYVRIQIYGTDNLSLAEVQVFGESSYTTGKATTQSSTYFDCDASRAVDGNTNGDWNNASIIHTNLETNPWWQVEFGYWRRIRGIRIYNRTDAGVDRLSNYTVSIMNYAGEKVWEKNITTFPNPYTYICVPNVGGDAVKVQLNGSNYLNLAEVQVF